MTPFPTVQFVEETPLPGDRQQRAVRGHGDGAVAGDHGGTILDQRDRADTAVHDGAADAPGDGRIAKAGVEGEQAGAAVDRDRVGVATRVNRETARSGVDAV